MTTRKTLTLAAMLAVAVAFAVPANATDTSRPFGAADERAEPAVPERSVEKRDKKKGGPRFHMQAFKACMIEKGFVEGTDFKARLTDGREIAGVKVATGYETRVKQYVKTDSDLLALYNACRTANGLPAIS